MKEEISSTRITNRGTVDLKITNLKQINILFGKNGTGKSTFLRNLYQADSNNFHLIVPERGGHQISYGAGYLDQESDPNQRLEPRRKNSDENYRNRAFSRISIIFNEKGFLVYSGNRDFDIDIDEIISLFLIIIPEFKLEFNSQSPHKLEIFREKEEGDWQKVQNADELSSGQVEAMSLAADIITQAILWKNQDKVLLIDEPDSHLHIDLENRFAIFINEINERFNIQIVMATHSYSLVASLLNNSEDIGIICLDDKKETISAVQDKDKYILANLLSIDLALAVILNKKIMIIEGNDDFLVWNQAIRSQNFEDLALIQANGGDILNYKRNAEQILSVILDSNSQYGITILDKDNKDDPEKKDSDLLPALRLQCYSLENLFLTNEVLNYVTDSPDLNNELQELLDQSSDEEEKAEINNIIKDKRRCKISKELIYKISKKIDSHSSSRDWRIILGKVLGKSRPEGELEEFLGEDFVNYIWGEKSNNSEEE